jgi:hypothetical protein
MIPPMTFQISRIAMNVSAQRCDYEKELNCDRYPFYKIGSGFTCA